ncbi:MAG: hypothetical protein CMK99_13700 [Pseudomonas sp.]|nr:hypothetical protein [Pseudomonas sp.]HBS80990.1 hypothetical protein [Pseudomonas sp.]
MPVRIIVCGGRDYADRAFVFQVLDKIHTLRSICEIIQGDAPGADSLAKEWAKAHGIKHTDCPADWKSLGRRAGPIRNRYMLTLKPDGVVAFPGGRGTLDMISAAQEAGVPVYRPSPSGQP